MTSPEPSTSSTPTTSTRHALTAVEKQRSQLERLLKDPSKPAYIPAPPKDKTIRAAREMMKNVQGSSAGAGSGEFHVYKAARRREYERLKLLDDEAQNEQIKADFERKRKEAEDVTNSKTAKNRAKRQKKKERSKGKGAKNGDGESGDEVIGKATDDMPSAPLKKRRLVNGKELVFKRPGEEDDDDEAGVDGEDGDEVGPALPTQTPEDEGAGFAPAPIPLAETPRITIIDDD
ncbi:DUF1168-domain-containing protein [Coprinopsis marcescibilis]|uniref:DUF1168-domain-containing protein n=1 Tax=Coprinopsis marcescibilis TaxID=230819 RepID=A0A5C3KYH0_COPMA|nr:DUF1168-domain-containing protein [Coprinopsis marcescibilis]